VCERLVRNTKELFAGSGQLQRGVDPVKERLSDLLFEGLDLAADRRLRDTQFLSRVGETQMTRRGPEASEQIE
jgi:hypothetical protein